MLRRNKQPPAEEVPRYDAPKTDAPKTDAPKTDAPKNDAPKKESTKKDAPKKGAPKDDAEKEGPKCTCGCPIHTEKCRLFYNRYTNHVYIRDPFIQPSGGPRCTALPEDLASSETFQQNASAWALQQMEMIVEGMIHQSLSRDQRKVAWRKKMLVYHPDKRNAPDNPTTGRDVREVAEVFQEVKRRHDRC